MRAGRRVRSARAMKMGALGVADLYERAGKPLDHPDSSRSGRHEQDRDAIWMHPSRTAASRLRLEPKSKYEIWWTLGWSYETAAAMSAGVLQDPRQVPELKIITHHMGASCRCWKPHRPGLDQIGARTSTRTIRS